MTALRIRCYNVRFGDAFLVTVPDRDEDGAARSRHVLFDVGNVLGGEGGQDEVFRPVLEDVAAELDGQALDLYVMTHEHLDHVQGLLFAAEKFGIDLDVDHAWLTASAATDYYERFPDAKKKLQLAHATYDAVDKQLAAAPAAVRSAWAARLANNNPRKTADCVAHLRGLAAPANTHFVHRGYDVADAHPFRDVSFEIWAPEEDTTDYYGRFRPAALGMAMGAGAAVVPDGRPLPPPGVDVGAFETLVQSRANGFYANLMTIDKAANDTSVVLCMEWRGWRFLFAGDAEERSWKTMRREGVLQPVHFLKVSHHGSHNGTPRDEILDAFLPPEAPDGAPRHAVVSTCAGSYNGVPHEPTTDRLAGRCEVHSTEGLADGEAFDLLFYA